MTDIAGPQSALNSLPFVPGSPVPAGPVTSTLWPARMSSLSRGGGRSERQGRRREVTKRNARGAAQLQRSLPVALAEHRVLTMLPVDNCQDADVRRPSCVGRCRGARAPRQAALNRAASSATFHNRHKHAHLPTKLYSGKPQCCAVLLRQWTQFTAPLTDAGVSSSLPYPDRPRWRREGAETPAN